MQWLVDEQLDHVQTAVRRAGMPLWVLHDLAVGVQSTGSEAWSLRAQRDDATPTKDQDHRADLFKRLLANLKEGEVQHGHW